jgi:hypothetical protein
MFSRFVLSYRVSVMDELRNEQIWLSGEIRLRALLVVSLLPVSEINQCFRPGCGRAGGGLQVRLTEPSSCASQLEAIPG